MMERACFSILISPDPRRQMVSTLGKLSGHVEFVPAELTQLCTSCKAMPGLRKVGSVTEGFRDRDGRRKTTLPGHRAPVCSLTHHWLYVHIASRRQRFIIPPLLYLMARGSDSWWWFVIGHGFARDDARLEADPLKPAALVSWLPDVAWPTWRKA
jgi:hypothetical protein